MVRIAWLHSHFLLWSGGTKFVYEVARRIHKVIPVDMIVERCSPQMHDMFRSEGMEVIEINTRSSTSLWYWLFFLFYLKRDIRKIQQLKNRYSFLITSMFPMNYVAYAAKVDKYMPYIMEPFAFFHDIDMIRGFPFFKRIMLHFLSFFNKNLDIKGMQESTVLMTINSGTAEWISEIYGRDATPTYLGVDTDFFSPKFNDLKKKYEGRKTVIHSTDFTPLKKTWDAVKIIEILRKQVPEVKLLITWSSENKKETAKLRKYIKNHSLEDNIELSGHIDHEDLPYYYSLADVSLYTGIGHGASAASLFVLECMACQTPGIRTNFTTDEIEHNVTGFLYCPGDEENLKKYLIELLTNDSLREKFGQIARQRVLAKYNWDLVAECMIETIKSTEN